MKTLIAASIATMLFLIITIGVGLYQTLINYLSYGPSYIETIIINNVETSIVITWYNSVLALVLLVWIVALLSFLTKYIYWKDKAENQS